MFECYVNVRIKFLWAVSWLISVDSKSYISCRWFNKRRNTFRQERTWTRQQNQSSHDGLEGFNQTSSFSLERLSKHTVLNSRRRICAAALLTWAATGYKQRGGLTRRRPFWCSQTVRDNDWLHLQQEKVEFSNFEPQSWSVKCDWRMFTKY